MANLSKVDYKHFDLEHYGTKWAKGAPIFTFFYPNKKIIKKILKMLDYGWSLNRACSLYEVEPWRVLNIIKTLTK